MICLICVWENDFCNWSMNWVHLNWLERSLDLAGQRLTFRGRSRACSNKMASASATPSSRNLQLIEGNSDGEHRPVPSPAYMAAAEDVIPTEEKKVEWWCGHKEQLPCWASAVKQVLLVQPSSPTPERVFSILRASFNEQQNCALVDYLQA